MTPFFIDTQRLWKLVCPPANQQECLRPERIWTLSREGDDENVRPIDLPGLPPGRCRWEVIPDRDSFLADLSHDRLCITIDAGVGKTTALAQTQYLRQAANQREGLAMQIYLAWPQMLEIAGYPSVRDDNGVALSWEELVRRGTQQAQREALQRVEPGIGLSAAAQRARELLWQFLGEYPRIRQGARGAVAQRIANDFAGGFRKMPQDDGESSTLPMGAEAGVPGRPVTIPAAFELSRYAVTNELYALFDAGHTSRHSDLRKYSPEPTCPVIYVDWFDAWCCSLWLGGHLPTETEWEYACRAGSTGSYCFGDEEERLADFASYANNAQGRAHPVGKKQPNDWGLYDMHGNAWEWCDSWLGESGSSRVLRGGSWFHYADNCRCANRPRNSPERTLSSIGFRVCRRLFVS